MPHEQFTTEIQRRQRREPVPTPGQRGLASVAGTVSRFIQPTEIEQRSALLGQQAMIEQQQRNQLLPKATQDLIELHFRNDLVNSGLPKAEVERRVKELDVAGLTRGNIADLGGTAAFGRVRPPTAAEGAGRKPDELLFGKAIAEEMPKIANNLKAAGFKLPDDAADQLKFSKALATISIGSRPENEQAFAELSPLSWSFIRALNLKNEVQNAVMIDRLWSDPEIVQLMQLDPIYGELVEGMRTLIEDRAVKGGIIGFRGIERVLPSVPGIVGGLRLSDQPSLQGVRPPGPTTSRQIVSPSPFGAARTQ